MNIFIALKYLEICDNIKVTTAGNGESAVPEFSRANYDMILTDANMPTMNGYTLASKAPDDLYRVVYEEMIKYREAQVH